MAKKKVKGDIPRKPDFTPGIYRHYKGGLYFATELSLDSGSLKWRVQYYSAETPTMHWSRPFSEWWELVIHNGERQYRFQYLAGKTVAQIRTFLGI